MKLTAILLAAILSAASSTGAASLLAVLNTSDGTASILDANTGASRRGVASTSPSPLGRGPG